MFSFQEILYIKIDLMRKSTSFPINRKIDTAIFLQSYKGKFNNRQMSGQDFICAQFVVIYFWVLKMFCFFWKFNFYHMNCVTLSDFCLKLSNFSLNFLACSFKNIKDVMLKHIFESFFRCLVKALLFFDNLLLTAELPLP